MLSAPSTHNVGLHTLSEEGWSAFWWLLGVVLLCVYRLVLALMIGTLLANISVDQGRMLAASFNTFPMVLITIGMVYALAGRLCHAAVLGILTAYLVLSFLEELLEGIITFP